MAVPMNRSTKTAPVSLSTSYFTGSLPNGISMMTLTSLGTSWPEVTRFRGMPDPGLGLGEAGSIPAAKIEEDGDFHYSSAVSQGPSGRPQ